MHGIEAALSALLCRWVDAVRRHANPVLGLIGITTIGLFVFAAFALGINSDNVSMIGEELQARKNYLEFARSFPNIENVMLVVIDGETPELAREATETLQKALQARPDLFREVYIPGAGEFFQKHGLLYRDLDDLDEFSLQISQVQPILTALEQDPTVAHLASLIQKGLEQNEEEAASLDDMAVLLDRVGDATIEAYSEFPIATSWEEILLRGSSVDPIKQWILVIDPILDFDSLFAAAAPMAEVRRIAAEAGLDADHGVRVRLTGNPVLNYEEMNGLLWDIGMGGVLTFFFVVLVLLRALRTLKLVIAAVVTLLVGLVWTGAFAAAAVGSLNLISLSFAILFIGLGVDFTIHLGMAYAAALREIETGEDLHARALAQAVDHVGSSLVLCTITTSIGFYVFVPTDNIGVAELGLIAGSGMIINLLLTTTLFPALLTTVCKLDFETQIPERMHFSRPWWRGLARIPGLITTSAALLLGFGIWQTLQIQFDANVVRMRDPDTESVQAFDELLEEAGPRSPWPLDTIAPDLDSAVRLAREVEAIDVVDSALTLADYVPENQEEKLMILEDVGMILDAPRSRPDHESVPSTKEQIAALRALRDYLAAPSIDSDRGVLAASMRALRDRLDEFLVRADTDTDVEAALARLEVVLLGGLEKQLERLRDATLVDEVTIDDLPRQLRDRMLTADGRARVQIFPAEKLTDEAAFTRFALEVTRLVPSATGLPSNLVAFAQATRESLREALTYAVVLISTFLLILWRRPVPVLLVLAPLLLSNFLTVGLMATFGIAFNFANVVVVPLMLGIGVDSGIHLVHRAEFLARTEGSHPEDLLATTTARAVFYSAVTTTVSFGTLALSSHRGVASLGVVLAIGMTLTVLANLVVLPALLSLVGPDRPSDATTSEAGSADA